MQFGPITVYGDSISGNCGKVRFVCDRLAVPYTWIETSVVKAETRTPAFQKLNPAGQVPLIVLPDGRSLSQSNAIIRYLAEGSDLIPADRYDRAVMDQWMFWEQYSHEPVIAVRRFHLTFLRKSESEIDPSLMPRGERVFAVMNGHLADRPYFAAGHLTLADIALVAYTRMAHEGGFDLARWPAVLDWVRRVEADLKLPAYGG